TVALRPRVKPKIVKKRTNKFIRHQPDRSVKIKWNWWKPRGTGNTVHRGFQGQILMPSTGYGSNKKTKYMLPSDFRKSLVHSVKELDVLLTCHRSHCAEMLTRLLRPEPLWKEQPGWPSVTNPNARLLSEENE
uniref:60S ribosomal protein L32 n=1 Tax=Myotis lucifugus TaxID=59463 RepID=G1QFQ4_MYOLU